MNRETMSTRATLALAAMAADRENLQGSIPNEDTVNTIDDILSIATSIEFYGKKTKSYRNPKDEKSGSYCTVPVRYEFADKDTRIEAETFLRKSCGVNCATPYPPILRECIKQCIDKVKADYPDNQVKVAVDTKRFCLKVARRCTVEGPDYNKKWNSYEKTIPLPKEALDVVSRKVPEGFKISFLPPGRDKGQCGSPVKVGDGGGGRGAGAGTEGGAGSAATPSDGVDPGPGTDSANGMDVSLPLSPSL
jgi:hypothetical protein